MQIVTLKVKKIYSKEADILNSDFSLPENKRIDDKNPKINNTTPIKQNNKKIASNLENTFIFFEVNLLHRNGSLSTCLIKLNSKNN